MQIKYEKSFFDIDSIVYTVKAVPYKPDLDVNILLILALN